MLLRRIFLMLIGLSLIALVIYLGFIASTNTNMVLWYGLASAILAPFGLSLISASLNLWKDNIMKKLLKVPEIDHLVQKAETQEEKIKILQAEREQLQNIVKYETIKHAIIERRKHLENEAKRILDDLSAIDNEISKLKLDEKDSILSNDIIESLYRRIESQKGINATIGIFPFGFVESLSILTFKFVMPAIKKFIGKIKKYSTKDKNKGKNAIVP